MNHTTPFKIAWGLTPDDFPRWLVGEMLTNGLIDRFQAALLVGLFSRYSDLTPNDARVDEVIGLIEAQLLDLMGAEDVRALWLAAIRLCQYRIRAVLADVVLASEADVVLPEGFMVASNAPSVDGSGQESETPDHA